MPLRGWELAGEDGGARAVAVLEDLEEVTTFLILHRGEPPVVDQEDVEAGKLGEQADVGAVGAGEGELVVEAGGAAVAGTEAPAAGLMGPARTAMKLFPPPGAPTRITLWCSATPPQVASWRMTALSSSRRAGASIASMHACESLRLAS